MRCSIDCMNYLLDYYSFDDQIKTKIILEMENALTDRGLSIYDFICIVNQYHFYCRAIKSLWIPKKTPLILYFKRRNKAGHYMVMVRRERFYFIVHDPIVGIKRIHKLWLYLFWSHICIVCYN